VLVTSCPSLHNVVQLEPTLEAIYYEHFPCELTLRTWEGYIPFFENHPLIENVITKDSKIDFIPEVEIIEISDLESWDAPVATVDKFAISAKVQLLRKTPKIFLNPFPPDRNIVVQADVPHLLDSWHFPNNIKSFKEIPIVRLEQPKNNDYLRLQLKVLASSALVVGPDSWMTQAAAALDARVVMGLDSPHKEPLRAPINVTVSNKDKDSIFNTVQDVLYEKRYPDFLNCGNAAEFIKNKAKMYMKSNFIDVGCSNWPIPNGIPVDTHNREIIEKAPDNYFSGVFSSHCLEHIRDWKKELKLWHRVTRNGGYIFMYLPHPRAEVWHAFTGSWVGDNHVWNPEPVTLVKFLKEELGMNIIEYTSRRDSLWSYYIIARKYD